MGKQRLHLYRISWFGHANANSYARSDTHTNCDSNRNAHAYTDSDANSYADRDRYTDTHSDSNSDSHSNSYGNADSCAGFGICGDDQSCPRINLYWFDCYLPVDRRQRYPICPNTW
jgi:hypothetical protein